MRVYLDSNIFIYAMETDYDEGLRARRLLHQVERGEHVAVTSEIALAEVLRGGDALLKRSSIDAYIELLSTRAGPDVIPVRRDLLVAAASLELERKVNLPDAIHLATAIWASCQALVTEDKRMPVPPPLRKVSLTDWLPDL